jgi:hypothetical protein
MRWSPTATTKKVWIIMQDCSNNDTVSFSEQSSSFKGRNTFMPLQLCKRTSELLPSILLENIPHTTLIGTYQGYILDYGVLPSLFVQGKVCISAEENKHQSAFQAGEELDIQDACKVLWWSKDRPLLCIHLGNHAICIEPVDVWKSITIRYQTGRRDE